MTHRIHWAPWSLSSPLASNKHLYHAGLSSTRPSIFLWHEPRTSSLYMLQKPLQCHWLGSRGLRIQNWFPCCCRWLGFWQGKFLNPVSRELTCSMDWFDLRYELYILCIDPRWIYFLKDLFWRSKLRAHGTCRQGPVLLLGPFFVA